MWLLTSSLRTNTVCAATQLSKQQKATADAQHARASRDAALLDAAAAQRIAQADKLRRAPMPATTMQLNCISEAHVKQQDHDGRRFGLAVIICSLAPCRHAAEADAKASEARFKQAIAELSRVKAAADGARVAAQEQASRQTLEITRLHQGAKQQCRAQPYPVLDMISASSSWHTLSSTQARPHVHASAQTTSGFSSRTGSFRRRSGSSCSSSRC